MERRETMTITSDRTERPIIFSFHLCVVFFGRTTKIYSQKIVQTDDEHLSLSEINKTFEESTIQYCLSLRISDWTLQWQGERRVNVYWSSK